MKHEKLDTVDRIILDILQENAKTPLKKLQIKFIFPHRLCRRG